MVATVIVLIRRGRGVMEITPGGRACTYIKWVESDRTQGPGEMQLKPDTDRHRRLFKLLLKAAWNYSKVYLENQVLF